MPLLREEQIVQLNVSMCYSILMQVSNSLEELLKEAHIIYHKEVVHLHQGKQLPPTAIFHYVVPATIMSAETNSLDYIRMVKTVRNTEFRLDLILILVQAFFRSSFSKLLGCVWDIPIILLLVNYLDDGGPSPANLFRSNSRELQVVCNRELITEFATTHDQVFRNSGTYLLHLQSGTSGGRD